MNQKLSGNRIFALENYPSEHNEWDSTNNRKLGAGSSAQEIWLPAKEWLEVSDI
jgi:hypothetical protein